MDTQEQWKTCGQMVDLLLKIIIGIKQDPSPNVFLVIWTCLVVKKHFDICCSS